MPAFGYESGSWQQVLNMYTYHSGVWTLVHGAWEYNGSAWKQYYSNNAFQIYACGLQQNVVSSANRGLWQNGVQVYSAARSYNVVLFDNYGNITGNATFDVFGDAGATGGTTATQNMINYLNGLNGGQIYAIFSYDEPSTGAANLASTMTSFFGGTTSILGSGLAYRGAYVAIGKKGQAPYIEKYAGTYMNSVSNPGASSPQADQGCLDGLLRIQFQIYTVAGPNGAFVNENNVYQGGNLINNSAQVGMASVAGITGVF